MDDEPQQPARVAAAGSRYRRAVADRRRQWDVKLLDLTLKWMQLVFRFLAVIFELAALAFLGYIYDSWRRNDTVRVDVVFPSFFPLTAAMLVNLYEIFSLLLASSSSSSGPQERWQRRWPINPFIILFDCVVTGVSIFCFLVLGFVDYEGNQRTFAPGSVRAVWATDMNNAMVFMVAFCLLHAMFVVLGCAGFVYRRMHLRRQEARGQVSQAQAEMVQFHERQRQQAEMEIAKRSEAAVPDGMGPEAAGGGQMGVVVTERPVDLGQAIPS